MWEGASLDVWVDWGMRLRAAAGRDLGVLVHGKLNMSQQCPGSQEGRLCPGALGKAFLVRQGIVLLCFGAAPPQVLGAVLGTTI